MHAPTRTRSRSSSVAVGGSQGPGFSRAKTVMALTVVVGCFAILWPKIFYPMLTASLPGGGGGSSGAPGSGPGLRHPREEALCCDVIAEKDTHAYKLMNEICAKIIAQQQQKSADNETQTQATAVPIQLPPDAPKWRKSMPPAELPPAVRCRNEILHRCDVDVTVLLRESSVISKEYKEALAALRGFRASKCLRDNYGVDVGLQRTIKSPEAAPSYMHQERPLHVDGGLHPALREKGSAIPQSGAGPGVAAGPRRTLDIEARPGPKPGVRPPMGHGAHYVPPTRERSGPGGGTMGIIMPLYTLGIVVFFLYTIFKILFRKPIAEEAKSQSQQQPRKASEFGMAPESSQTQLPRGYQNNHDAGVGVGRRYSTEQQQQAYYGGRRRSSVGIAPVPLLPVVQDISQPRQMAVAQRQGRSRPAAGVYELNGEAPEAEPVVTAVQGIIAEMDKFKSGVCGTKPKPGATAVLKEADADKSAKSSDESSTTTTTTLQMRDGSEDKENRKPAKLFAIADTVAFSRFVHDLSSLILNQALATASAAIAFEQAAAEKKAKAQQQQQQPTGAASASVLGMVERAGMEGGYKWPPSSPTPSPSLSPRVLTPPPLQEPVPNIYLEGPIPPESDQLMVADERSEGVPNAYDSYSDEDEDSKPVVLSGKVTLSMFSSAASTATGATGYGDCAGGGADDLTEAASMSMDGNGNGGLPRMTTTARGAPDLSDALANAMNDVNGVVGAGAGSTKASSPDMDEYEVVGKAGVGDDEEDTQYATAEAADGSHLQLQANWAADETAADISAIDGAGAEDEEEDEEVDYEEEEEEEEEELEGDGDDEEEEEEEEDDQEPPPAVQPRGGGRLPQSSGAAGSSAQGGGRSVGGGGGLGLRLGSFDSVASSSSSRQSQASSTASSSRGGSGSRSPIASPNGTYFTEP